MNPVRGWYFTLKQCPKYIHAGTQISGWECWDLESLLTSNGQSSRIIHLFCNGNVLVLSAIIKCVRVLLPELILTSFLDTLRTTITVASRDEYA